MPARKIVTPPAAIDFQAIRDELNIPARYPADAVAEATSIAATASTGLHPEAIPFVTVDPVGSMDLDQAVHLERAGDGYLVHYAIADVSILRHARRRSWPRRPGAAARPCTARTSTPRCTRWSCPRVRPACCPAAPDPAVLWTIRLDARGEPVEVDVRRTAITSVARAELPGRAGRRRCRHAASVDRTAPGDRPTPAGAVPRAARDQPGHPGLGDRPGPGRAMDAGAAGGAAGGAVQRGDQPADRDVRGVDHARRRCRAAQDAAGADRRAGRGPAENHCGAGHSVAGVGAAG